VTAEPSTSPAPREPARSERLTIAVLLDYLNSFGGGYEAQLRDALDAECRELGHNLVLIYGAALEGPRPVDSADNAIYRRLRPGTFDGVIVVSTLLGAYCDPEMVARLIESYRPTHLCSLGIAFPGIPSVVLDNRTGMAVAVEHLVRDHGCRRPVFLAGTPRNPEAQARLAAYREVLERNGIALDPALVGAGNFLPARGRAAMEEILARSVPFDSVVAANDTMAVGAIEALRQSGRRVPQDIPVVGFDDLLLARQGNPPLTTVAQPFELTARLAIQNIVDQHAGRAVPPCTEVPSHFVRRQSCGCGYQPPRGRGAATPRPVADTVQARQAYFAELRPVVAAILRSGAHNGSAAASRLLEGITAAVAGEADAFAQAVADLLATIGDDVEYHWAVQQAVIFLRDALGEGCDARLERILYDGLVQIAQSHATMQMQHRLTLDESYVRLLAVAEHASVAFDRSSLKTALCEGLPAAGVRTAFLSCAADDNPAELEATLCLCDGVPVDPPVPRFPLCRLLPPEVLPRERRYTFLVLPLAFEAQLLGLLAFDYADGINAYAAFRNEITAVLKSIRLHQELVQETKLHERSVQERLAATKRMDALGVLAGGVAHDLNNALGPLITLPEVILDELGRLPVPESTIRELRADVDSIRSASLHAAQTIKDLLTLGRQGHTVREGLDLNRVVKACLAESSPRFASEGHLHVNMVVDYAGEPLTVRGSESQLGRAVGNLVRNALDAVAGNGEIVVRTCRQHLVAPVTGYETIPAGHYAVLSVADDGCGIAAHEMAHVFEPFFTTKRAGDTSGSGLGLAIVHGVAKEHEGFIDVTSLPDTGTTFSLYLPLVDVPAAAPAETVLAPRGRARVLIVDDDPMQLRTCRRVLVRLGYEVEVQQSGLRAYELFNQAAAKGQSPFDLIIMDMVLNEMLDGLQIIELIQRLFPTQKAIVASGHAPTERADLAVKKGLPWLAKPYSLQALVNAVEQVLRGEGGG